MRGYSSSMNVLFDAFWRATAYCAHPRVIGLSLLPVLLLVALSFGLGYFAWDPLVAGLTEWLAGLASLRAALDWLQSSLGVGALGAMLAALLLVFLALPLIVLLSLFLVALIMTPALVDLVARRRFTELERRNSVSVLASLRWSLGSTLLALLALVVSMPFWLIPPLVLILPPLIWGWLTYRVFAFDALAAHADAAERQLILKTHRGQLLLMGVICGYLGAAPSLLWASGAMAVALAPLFIPLAVWLYTLVFAFASLWFAHYTLAALQRLRAGQAPQDVGGAGDPAAPGDLLPSPKSDKLPVEGPDEGVQS